MNILVTGANGQLGNEMRIISKKHTLDNYIFTDVTEQEGTETVYLDITKLQDVRKIVAMYDIEAIVNCAAYTNVDAAETNEPIAEKLNAEAPENLAIAMKEVNGLLVHISTDYVFGKESYNTPCKEEQKGTPTGVYGMTKMHGEQRVKDSGCRYIIIRTAWLYSEFGKNFCKTMLQLTASRPQLKVVFDQVGTPTYAWDLACTIATVLKNPIEGIYHFSNEGVCSWYDFAKTIQQIAHELKTVDCIESKTQCEVLPCHSNEFPSPVKRPSYSVLDKTKIKETYSIKIPYWTDSLRKCIQNLQSWE